MKQRIGTFLLIILVTQYANAQTTSPATDTIWKSIYRSTSEKIFDLVHT
ncbi:MAG: hypothetical protein ACK55K_06065 [Bacteroidota bacterium]